MPVSITPVSSLEKLKYVTGNYDKIAYTAELLTDRYRITISDLMYLLNPIKADSVGKANIIDPTKTEPFDGDLSTAPSTFASKYGNTYGDGDAGVDMDEIADYLVLAKVGFYHSTNSFEGCVGLFGSPDLTTWDLLAEACSKNTTETILFLYAYAENYRAFKIMVKSTGVYETGYCRTYELSVFRVKT